MPKKIQNISSIYDDKNIFLGSLYKFKIDEFIIFRDELFTCHICKL